MRTTNWSLLTFAAAVAIVLPASPIRFAAAEKKGSKPTSVTDDELVGYRTVGDYTAVRGLTPARAEGVGLVVGLHGTGSDPVPNRYRELILKEMHTREVPNPESVLASDSTAVVLLRAFLPPGARRDDTVDIEVWVPPGDATSSLKGGRLLEARLHENLVTKGQLSTGQELIRAYGPLLIWDRASPEADPAAQLKGKILGGGRLLIDRDFQLVINTDSRSAVRAKVLADRINQRFYESEHGQNRGLAHAKTDRIIELKTSRTYKFDIERFLQVVRRIPISQSVVIRQHWQQELRAQLLEPKTAIEASLKLEAIGKEAIPVIKEGLSSKVAIVRFSAAQTLAYLGDSSGATQLAALAQESTLYRAHALSGLIAVDHPVSRMHLTELLQARGAETRYGAFRALWAYDPGDPTVAGRRMGLAAGESADVPGRRRVSDADAEFMLHVIESKAEPMVHVARNFRREVVLFNGDQELIRPFNLRAGEQILLHADANSDRVHIVSFRPGRNGVVERRNESSLRLREVIETTATLGASYADVVEMLRQASQNGNLSGRLAVNALPAAMSFDTLVAVGANNDESPIARRGGAATGLFAVPTEPLDQATSPLVEVDEEKTAAEQTKARKPGLRGLFRRSAN